jgi:hypothetical protein
MIMTQDQTNRIINVLRTAARNARSSDEQAEAQDLLDELAPPAVLEIPPAPDPPAIVDPPVVPETAP